MADTLRLAAPVLAPPTEGAVELVGRSLAIRRVQEFVCRAAGLDGGVLVTAEHGAAVDSVAREIHARSRQSKGAFVIVPCGAGDPARLERLLFGEPIADAPTDLESIAGNSRIADARGGVLFLQDVTELRAAAQARLARIARDGQLRVDGALVETGFRLIASASPGVGADVEAHRLRSDLHRRLSQVRIDLPPLRERQEDVPALAMRLLDDVCAARGIPPRTFSQPALALVGAIVWRGNLMELKAAIERVVSETRGGAILIEQVLPALQLQRAPEPFTPTGNLRDARLRFERDYIAAVLQHHSWHIGNAAQTLGIHRPNLYRKARQLGIPLARATE